MSERKPVFEGLVNFAERHPYFAHLFNTNEKGPLLVEFKQPRTRGDRDGNLVIDHWYYKEQDDFSRSMSSRVISTPIRQLEQEIAEWHFRRYIPLPELGIAIRPFWRDRKIAPPLPFEVPPD